MFNINKIFENRKAKEEGEVKEKSPKNPESELQSEARIEGLTHTEYGDAVNRKDYEHKEIEDMDYEDYFQDSNSESSFDSSNHGDEFYFKNKLTPEQQEEVMENIATYGSIEDYIDAGDLKKEKADKVYRKDLADRKEKGLNLIEKYDEVDFLKRSRLFFIDKISKENPFPPETRDYIEKNPKKFEEFTKGLEKFEYRGVFESAEHKGKKQLVYKYNSGNLKIAFIESNPKDLKPAEYSFEVKNYIVDKHNRNRMIIFVDLIKNIDEEKKKIEEKIKAKGLKLIEKSISQKESVLQPEMAEN